MIRKIFKWIFRDEIGVIRYEPNSCQFRIQFDPKTNLTSLQVGLQMGEKGQAVKIGSVYTDPSPVPWAVEKIPQKPETIALSIVLSLNERQARLLAAIYGNKSEDYELQLATLLTRAEKDPEEFLNNVNKTAIIIERWNT